jgi:DNA polymerase elongation subunit (family B)
LYIDAIYSKEKDRILVAEKVNGKFIIKEELPEYVFYYESQNGTHKSIYGDYVKKFQTHDSKKFRSELAKKRASGVKIFESDINTVFRHLANNYMGAELPKLNVGFFDIEVDFNVDRGYAPTDDPFSPITAISLYSSEEEICFTLVLCPPTYNFQEAETISSEFPNTVLFDNEKELLNTFLELIDDVNVLTGWNSEGFDIPYVVNRIKRILGEDAAKRLCLWDQNPREREYIKFNRPFKTYELVGRVHLDYLLLYQKHNTQQQHSYRLDFIGEIEVGDNKTPYEGTLDELYKKEFKRFIEYNRQDVMLMVKIDKKKKFIELANQIAHENCILFKTTMGTVSFVEQAIINEMHQMGFVVADRKPKDKEDDEEDTDEDRQPVVGAYVAKPKTGLHSHVGAMDINSLYPSAIRALNMSPETIFGQVRQTETLALIAKRVSEGTPRTEAWEGIFAILEFDHMHAKDNEEIVVDFEDGREWTTTGAGLYEYIFNPKNQVCISANGTIFRTDKEGMIPTLLSKWYAERKQLQAKAKFHEEQYNVTKNPEDLRLYIYYEQRQYAMKILLNSLYGALLQRSCRFEDERLGQSTTLTGRSIVRHMGAKINEIITGKYDHYGSAIYYGDTDSNYFSAYEYLKDLPEYKDFEWSRENIIELYDAIADQANETFAEFMAKTFNTSLTRGAIIKAGREIIASKALFIKKKKYAALIYDKEGIRLDANGKPGKLKVMGLDMKRADTPKFMQQFLEKLLMDVLQDADQTKMYNDIKEFREKFVDRPGWEKGSPKKISNLSKYMDLLEKANAVNLDNKGKKYRVNMSGHAKASMNWNNLCEMYNDKYVMRITDGTRIIVCKLKPNAMKIDSVAFPIDEPHIPKWFKQLPFDNEGMENIIIDAKIKNLVGVLNWDLSQTKNLPGGEFFSFGDEKPEKDERFGHNGGPDWDEDDDDDD